MTAIDTDSLAAELLDQAAGKSSGRAARALRTGQGLAVHHTMLALTAGSELSEHDNPGEATLLVLRGRIRLVAGDEHWELPANRFAEIPPRRHTVTAIEDSVFFLTTHSR